MISSNMGEVKMEGPNAVIKAEMATLVRVFVEEFGRENFDEITEITKLNEEELLQRIESLGLGKNLRDN